MMDEYCRELIQRQAEYSLIIHKSEKIRLHKQLRHIYATGCTCKFCTFQDILRIIRLGLLTTISGATEGPRFRSFVKTRTFGRAANATVDNHVDLFRPRRRRGLPDDQLRLEMHPL